MSHMSQTENEREVMAVACECIIRRDDVYSVASRSPWLVFLGQSFGLQCAVDRVNDGSATETDLLMLSAFPVFDADVEPVLLVEAL